MNTDDRDPRTNPDLKADAARRAAEQPSVGKAVKAHPVGVAAGAAAGVAAGAVGGIAAGPVGSLFGAVAGGVLGGVAASGFNAEAGAPPDDKPWRAHHAALPADAAPFEAHEPAYRLGAEAYRRVGGERAWDDVEPELAALWSSQPAGRLPWEEVRASAHAAWQHASDTHAPDSGPLGQRSGGEPSA